MADLYKYPEESRLYAFDFADQTEIAGGDTLASGATVTDLTSGSATLVIGAAAISGTQVQANISGGAAGDSTTLLAQVTTAAGKVLACQGRLIIRRTD